MLPQAPDILNLIGSLQCSLLQTTFFYTAWKFFNLFSRIYQAVSFGELVPAEDISFLCRWHWLPIFLWYELLFQRSPLWFEHRSHLSWSPFLSTAVSGWWLYLLCVSGERSLLCYCFALWLANYFLLKLGHLISFFLPKQFICLCHFLDVDINVTLLQTVSLESLKFLLSVFSLIICYPLRRMVSLSSCCPSSSHKLSGSAELPWAIPAGLQERSRKISSGIVRVL